MVTSGVSRWRVFSCVAGLASSAFASGLHVRCRAACRVRGWACCVCHAPKSAVNEGQGFGKPSFDPFSRHALNRRTAS
eukprot:842419-Prymnesium_polylepis.2